MLKKINMNLTRNSSYKKPNISIFNTSQPITLNSTYYNIGSKFNMASIYGLRRSSCSACGGGQKRG